MGCIRLGAPFEHLPLLLEKVVRPGGLELPTFWFVARRSIQLSYGRAVDKYYHNASSSRHGTQSSAGHAFAESRLPNSARCSSGPRKITSAPVKSTTAANSPMARL
jgi:hypothetical protein